MYSLPDGFDINDYENWVPAHPQCNLEKSGKVYDNLLTIKMTLDRCAKYKEEAQRIELTLLREPTKAEFLTKVNAAIEASLISTYELQNLFLRSNIMDSNHEELNQIREALEQRADYQAKKFVSEQLAMADLKIREALSSACQVLGWSFYTYYVSNPHPEDAPDKYRHELRNPVDPNLNVFLTVIRQFSDHRLTIKIRDENRVLETVTYDLSKGASADWSELKQAIINQYTAAIKAKMQ